MMMRSMLGSRPKRRSSQVCCDRATWTGPLALPAFDEVEEALLVGRMIEEQPRPVAFDSGEAVSEHVDLLPSTALQSGLCGAVDHLAPL